LTASWIVNNQQSNDQWEVSTSRLFDSNKFGVLYRNENKDVVWEEITFSGDSQSMTQITTVVSGGSGNSRSKLSMDFYWKSPLLHGISGITWTYDTTSGPTLTSEIYTSFLHWPHIVGPYQIGQGSGNQQLNSMVVLTDEINFVNSFMAVNSGK
jgi:hypothetical protein